MTDLPHTISFAILYRSRIDSLKELPKEKQPPRNLWDKPYELDQYLDTVFKSDGKDTGNNKQDNTFYYDLEDLE